jgi:putative transposase
MGEVEANRDMVTRHDLRHDRHSVSLLTDHLVFSPKYRGKVLLGDAAEVAEEIIRETCKELDIEVIDKPFFRKESFTKETIISAKCWKSVYKTFKNCFIKKVSQKNASQSVGHGWEVVERYISGQKGYEKADTVPVIDEEKEKLRAHKTWYTSLYNKLFGERHQK